VRGQVQGEPRRARRRPAGRHPHGRAIGRGARTSPPANVPMSGARGLAARGRWSPTRQGLQSRRPDRRVALRVAGTALALVSGLALAGCGGGKTARAQALTDYLGQIEPLRLAVNSLLGGADPILSRLPGASPLAARGAAPLRSPRATLCRLYRRDRGDRAGHRRASPRARHLPAHLLPRGRLPERAHKRATLGQVRRAAAHGG
jgi:hypothetical protein